ncbi:hypothetical protein [Rheinheimera sp. UJ63]|uniref:hypothetical protein n=1 Tax=Rheinheimera sp. UJ63 TaxID=2910157 RepID=UPI001F1B2963|nr:hypothetical protein [Rheinheimera sp. UJ63]MCF4010646.1 hypothetical protein [Rheinheimera sp. UJ63]
MKNLIALSLFIPLLTACGGGESEPPIGPFSARLSTIPSVLNESSTLPVSVTVQNVKTSANFTVVSNIPQIIVMRGEGNNFTLQVAEVDREYSGFITLTAIDGTDETRRVLTNIQVTIDNSSFTEKLADIEFLQSQRERLVAATEEETLLVALRELMVLNNPSEQAAQTSHSAINTNATALSSAIAAIQVSNYKQGNVSDAQLITEYQYALTHLEEHMAPYRTLLNTLFSQLANSLPAVVQANQFQLNTQLKTSSFFTGNAALGQVVGDQWVFNDDVAYLADLTNNTCGL